MLGVTKKGPQGERSEKVGISLFSQYRGEPAQQAAVDGVGDYGCLPRSRVHLAAEKAVPRDERVEDALREDQERPAPDQSPRHGPPRETPAAQVAYIRPKMIPFKCTAMKPSV